MNFDYWNHWNCWKVSNQIETRMCKPPRITPRLQETVIAKKYVIRFVNTDLGEFVRTEKDVDKSASFPDIQPDLEDTLCT